MVTWAKYSKFKATWTAKTKKFNYEFWKKSITAKLIFLTRYVFSLLVYLLLVRKYYQRWLFSELTQGNLMILSNCLHQRFPNLLYRRTLTNLKILTKHFDFSDKKRCKFFNFKYTYSINIYKKEKQNKTSIHFNKATFIFSRNTC